MNATDIHRGHRRWLLALSCLSVMLAGVIVMALLPGEPAEGPAQAAALDGAVTAPSTAAGAGLPGPEQNGTWIAVSLERPLFNQSRRPPSVAPFATNATADMPRLTGVIVGPFGRRAIFSGAEGAKPLVVEEGGSVGSYAVQRIDHGQVTLNGPDGTQVLRPRFIDSTNNTEADRTSHSGSTPAIGDLPPGVLPEDVAPPPRPGRRP